MSEFEESEELADEPTILPMDLDLGPDLSESTAPRNHAKVLEPDMAEIWPLIRQVLIDHRGQSLTVKALARRLNFDSIQSITLRRAVKKLLKSGKIVMAGGKTLALPTKLASKEPIRILKRPEGEATRPENLIRGIFKRHPRGFGFLRPMDKLGAGSKQFDLFVAPGDTADAATGDEVLVKRVKSTKSKGAGEARIVEILKRSAGKFVGTYYEERGVGWVRIDGTQFPEPLELGDPGAKRVRPEDKVAVEITRYPTMDRRGAAVIVAVLGQHGKKGVETQMILHAYELDPEFSLEVQAEARAHARLFEAMLAENKFPNRTNFRDDLIVTIDPAKARDFDDAISLHQYENGHWRLRVHIADVSAFVETDSILDTEARRRGNSVYLPDLVVPMLPEIISNSLASLQAGEPRLAVTVEIHFSSEGIVTSSEVHRSVILVRQRFSYEQAFVVMMTPPDQPVADQVVADDVRRLLERMHRLAMILRERRFHRGALELNLPEIQLTLDDDGRAKGAQLVVNDVSHQVIEEFMLAANEAVARQITQAEVPFLRRAHPDPDPIKLKDLAAFAEEVGFHVADPESRFELQKLLKETAGKPEQHAIHYGLLRSLKQATYTPEEIGHYALASKDYCHFTSPIRRYPDLVSHRQILDLIRGRKPFSDFDELAAIGEECTRTERKAASAERELIKLKILLHLQDHVGEVFESIITGVEDYGFYSQLVEWPIDGLVRLENLGSDSLWYYEEASRSIIAKRGGQKYRLGDRTKVRIADIDIERRELFLIPAELPWNPMVPFVRRAIAPPMGGGRPGPRRPEDRDQPKRKFDGGRSKSQPPKMNSQGRIKGGKKSKKKR
ncbi:MAG: VacB/RNase II family 3'-5' exoribonuclease [Planctomycetota bacterium]